MVTDEKIRDGNDKTPENVEITEKVIAEVDGNKVEVGFDANGKSYVENLPEGIDDENVQEFMEKVGVDKKVIEVGNKIGELNKTLIKAKTERTEQNKFKADYERLQNAEAEWKTKNSDLQTKYEALKSERSQSVANDDEVWDNTIEELKGLGIDIDDDDEISDFLATANGKRIESKHVAAYTRKLIEANGKRNLENFTASNTKATQKGQLKDLAKANEINPSDLLAFQEAKRLGHLPAEEVLKAYRGFHPRTNITDKINSFEEKKSFIPLYIGKGDRAVNRKITGDPFNGMSRKEIETLVRDHPKDPRVLQYRENRGKIS